MIRKLLGLVFNRWVLVAALLVAVGLAIWIGGPLLGFGAAHPLESERARWATIGSTLAAALLIALGSRWHARRGNAAVVRELLATPADVAPESADFAAVRQRFEQALQTLRRARFGRPGGLLAGWRARVDGRYLYELPWYLLVGAPGSGKTTALRHCGLRFPLAPTLGDRALHGVGGTRDCDWWFTDQAVLIDTAGRFTTQDSDRDGDRATWSGFLALLKRTRPRQPINGVLVTVAVPDLLTGSAAERHAHARTVRQRLDELHRDLDTRLPVYLLVTKVDLLAGFMDYFAALDRDQRASPWGMTFPVEADAAANLARFAPEFDRLLQRLNDGLVERLQAEPDAQRRARLYGFAGQFGGLKTALHEFLETAFAASPYEPAPLLRGAYLVSGTQEGSPIDRVLGTVARRYRIERAVMAPNQASGRSYFLSRLLGEVVFAESGLAGTNLTWQRRRAWLAAGAYAAIGTVTLGAAAAWSSAYWSNVRRVETVAREADGVGRLLMRTPNRASPDLLPIEPALAATRTLAGATAAAPWRAGWGLDQHPKLDSAARSAYDRMLVDAVLPRIALRLEDQLRQAGAPSESQYEALKTYLMLHDPQHFDAAAIKRHVEADWDVAFGRALDAESRARLSSHLDALLASGAAVSPLPEDRTLVEAVRRNLAATPLPQRIYNRMRNEGVGAGLPEFTLAKAGGEKVGLVFVRPSGKPLTTGVPGLYTRDGYQGAFQKELGRVARQLAEEQAWVLGIAETPADATATLRVDPPLLDDVRRLYLDEYVAVWEAFIADIRLQPVTSIAQLIQLSRVLAAPDSPMPRLLKALARETTLGSGAAKEKKPVARLLDRAGDAIADVRGSTVARLGGTKAPTPPERVEDIVDERFADLRSLVTPVDGGKAPIDETIALMAEVSVFVNAVDTALKGNAAPPPSPVPAKVKVAAPSAPEPLRAALESLAQSTAHLSQVTLRQILGKEVQSQVGEFCLQAISGRYPVDRTSARDATQADFAQLFAPGGRIDQLMQQKLAPYVDTSARPWRFKPVEGVALGRDAGTLPQLQRAQVIRETLFPAGSAASMKLMFKPLEMDPGLKQFSLDVDGQVVRYDHGPQIISSVVWPGPRGTTQVRVEVSPPLAAGATGMLYDGPWALFRLFDRVKVEPTAAPERFRATFDVDGRKAVFEVTASSVRNPFRLPELGAFACPNGL